jgi:hypothetical protein
MDDDSISIIDLVNKMSYFLVQFFLPKSVNVV